MSDEPTPRRSGPSRRRGQIIAAALMAVVALPLILAYVVYQTGVGIPEGQVNEGTLLEPPQRFARWQPRTLDGQAWDGEQVRERWRYIVPVSVDCTGQCRDNLYLTRQVHIRLGDKAHRVQRVILPLDGEPGEAMLDYLENEHPGTELLRADREAVMDSLAGTNRPQDPLAAHHYYLMDREGLVMMVYGPEHTGKQLLKDIKRLLRYSYDD